MQFDLVVAEKPSVARDIARVVGARQRHDGYLAGGTLDGRPVRVTWCVGHLTQLAPPERYDPAWKAWRQDALPMIPDRFQLEPRKEGGDQWKVVRELLCDRELDLVINACDAGREGELIFAYAYELAGCKAPTRRLWVNSMTDAALREGLDRLRPAADMRPLEAAARCRSEADWLVGLNATRAMTLHVRALAQDGPLLSVGRVQTPTLAILVQREEEIERFVSEAFFQVKAQLEAEPGSWEAIWVAAGAEGSGNAGNQGETRRAAPGASPDAADDSDEPPVGDDEPERDDVVVADKVEGRRDRIPDRAQADAIAARLRGKTGEVVHVRRKEAREKPPQFYDLTALQREANKRFKLSATKTLEVAQRLYEQHKLLTYPRTDSRHLSTTIVETLPQALRSLRFGPYEQAAHAALAAGPGVLGKRFVDDAEVGDHHAILPTGQDPRRCQLDADESRIFDLVARRLLGAFAGDAVFATAHVVVAVGDDRLHARGRTEVAPGWRAIDPPPSRTKERLLPAVEVGMAAKVRKATVHDGATRPPPRHTEASVLAAMERAGEQLEDEALARAMKAHGLGTPATRASIIETLIQRGYAQRDKVHLFATAQGRALLGMLPVEALVSPQLTGQWEARLTAIAEGREQGERFLADVRTFVAEICTKVAHAEPSPAARAVAAAHLADGDLLGACPRCGGEVRARRFGWSCGGCGLRIGDKVARRTVSAKMAKQLLATGTTDVVKGFRSKAGAEFASALRLDPERGVIFDFSNVPREQGPEGEATASAAAVTTAKAKAPAKAPAKAQTKAAAASDGAKTPASAATKAVASGDRDAPACPLCGQEQGPNGAGGQVLRGHSAWGCTRWKQGCGFRLPMHVLGVDLGPDLALLLQRGASATLLDSDGRRFRIRLDRREPAGWRVERPADAR